MSNSYFEEIPKTTSLDDLAIQNRNWDKAAAKLDSHQVQISKEVQDRVAAVQGHISAIAAHAAAAITLSPVTGLNANNLQTAVEQLRLMLTTIIAGPAPSAAEIQAARVGADNIARASLDILIKEIHAQQLAANTATAQLKHGQNVVIASEAGPVAVTLRGNTLVNLIPNGYGNFEIDSNGDGVADGWQPINQGTKTLEATTAKYGLKAQRIAALSSDTIIQRGIYTAGTHTIQSGKYYLLMVDVLKSSASAKAKIVLFNYASTITSLAEKSDTTMLEGLMYLKYSSSVDSTTIRVNMYNESPVGSTDWVQFDGVRLYEVDSATYAKIGVDPDFTGGKLAERYPYVDGVKHVTNPVITKIGKNLLPPFEEWTVNGGTQNITGPYEVEVTPSTWNHGPYIVIDSLPLTQYNIRVGETSGKVALDIASRDSSDAHTTMVTNELLSSHTFTTPANSVRLWIKIKNGDQTGKYKVANMQLKMGSAETPFEPRNDDYLYALTTLAGYGGVNDVFTIRGTEATVLRRWKTDVMLDGSFTWAFGADFTGYKRISAPLGLPVPVAGNVTNQILVKPDGVPNEFFSGDPTGPDQFLVTTAGTVFISIADSVSGWGETYTPSSVEMKACTSYGWKMNNGTFGQPYNGSGTKTWTRWNATSNTGAVTTVPSTMAEGYTPYKLSYQLAAPVTEVVPVEGSLANHAGLNLYEVGEGVVVREKVTPKFDTGRYYIITAASGVYWGDSRTKRSASRMLKVYKNGVQDVNWMETVSAPVNMSILAAAYDPTGEYTVSYLAADKYLLTAPVVEGALDYQTSAKSVQQVLVQRTADAETAITIHDLILAQHTARLLALEA